jgi:hypothetical protein
MCSYVVEGPTRSNIRWRSVPIPPLPQSEAHAPRLCFLSTRWSLESGTSSAPLELRLLRQFETLSFVDTPINLVERETRNQETRPHLLEPFIICRHFGEATPLIEPQSEKYVARVFSPPSHDTRAKISACGGPPPAVH